MEEAIEKLETLKPNKKPYGIGLDVVRIIAMFLVLMVHSTTTYGFVEEGVNSFVSVLVGAGRYLSYSCVAIFIILTGYLYCNKKPTVKYYVKLVKILIEFFLCAIIIAIFNKLYLGSKTDLSTILYRMFMFSFPDFSWYIRMYIGLFLIAPFLNYIIQGLNDKQCILLVVLSVIVFSYPFVANYWLTAYPLMYYFIGGIIRKKQIKVKRIYLVIAIIVVSFLQVLLFKFPISDRYNVENHNNLGCTIISVCIFLLFYNMNIDLNKKGGAISSKITRIIANASLSTFLISEIFERFTIKLFEKLALTTFSQKLPYLVYLTPIKFILSVICGIVISVVATYIYKGIIYLAKVIKQKIRSKKENISA